MESTIYATLEQSIRDALSQAVSEKAHRRYLGIAHEQLSERLSELYGGAEVLLASSGTASLEIGLRALGIGEGDRVLLSAYDYPGNAWAIERVGARPVLVDTEATGWRLDQQRLIEAIERTPGCRALIASHVHGQTQDARQLLETCTRRGIALIEDCCQAIAARRDSRQVGTWGRFATLSFGGGKLLSAGRGGALLTTDPALMQRCKIAAGAGSGPYAMSELQARVVVAQLPWLPTILETCQQYFREFSAALTQSLAPHGLPVTIPYTSEPHPSFYQAGLHLPVTITVHDQHEASALLKAYRQHVIRDLRAAGIPVGPGFDGLHRRSHRRCDKPVPLIHSQARAEGTFVLHHELAIQGEWPAVAVGELMAHHFLGHATKEIRPLLGPSPS
ncbi:MAG: aminotransferase [Pirellulaceae bacterium]|nr:MAG: aminotransferase [Pirellulaceae bacterium]